jgi:hypothetical protein
MHVTNGAMRLAVAAIAPATRHKPRLRRAGMAALLGGAAALFSPSELAAMELLGQAGVLGEWELTGNLAHSGSIARKEFSGPLTMKHVGICAQDGSEERTGEIRLHLIGRSESRLTAKLVLDGVPCTYTARKTDAYEGTMSCTGRTGVPLLIWLR